MDAIAASAAPGRQGSADKLFPVPVSPQARAASTKTSRPIREKTGHHFQQALHNRSPAVRIYRPARSVMQSGSATIKHWVIEFEPKSPQFIEPLMGWTGSSDTMQQVQLNFPTKEQAIAFAQRQGWSYILIEPHERKTRSKSYADNFRPRPPDRSQ